MPTPLVFSVFKNDTEAIFDTGEVGPIIRYESISLDPRLQTQLIDYIFRISQFSSTIQRFSSLTSTLKQERPLQSDASDELIQLGKIIFNHLMPRTIKKILTDSSPGDLILRLDERLLAIPWELAHDGNDFIGTKFRIGRQILRSGTIEDNPSSLSPFPQNQIKFLLILDPTGTLPEVNVEAEVLLELLDRQDRFTVEVIGGERATKLHILQALETFHIVHFAGHSISQYQNSQKIGWRLRDGILTPDEIGCLAYPPYLVFSNSCMAAASKLPEVKEEPASLPNSGNCLPNPTGNLGLGGNFLLAGVRQFVGALWVIHDQSSAEFAGAFYKKILSGESIGQSLLYAKHQAIQNRAVQTYIWAAYIHYGDPQQVLISGEASDGVKHPSFFSESIHQTRLRRWRFVCYRSMVLAIMVSLLSFAGYHYWPTTLGKGGVFNAGENVVAGMYAQAVADYQEGRIKQAIGALQHLVSRADNPSGLGLAVLSEIYAEAGLDEKAAALSEAAVKRNPHGAGTQFLLGEQYWRSGDAQKAERAFSLALEDPEILRAETARAYVGLGILSFYEGNLKRSEQQFEAALGHQPANADALTNLGVLWFNSGDRQKAFKHFSEALRIRADEEIALEFLDLLENSPPPVIDNEPNDNLRVAVGPFIFTSGVLQRIGLDILLTERLLRYRDNTASFQLNGAPSVYGPKYRSYGLRTLSELLNFTSHIKKTGCRIGLFGEFGITQHVIHSHLKLVDIHTGEIHLEKRIRTEGNNKVKNIIHTVESEVQEILARLENSAQKD